MITTLDQDMKAAVSFGLKGNRWKLIRILLNPFTKRITLSFYGDVVFNEALALTPELADKVLVDSPHLETTGQRIGRLVRARADEKANQAEPPTASSPGGSMLAREEHHHPTPDCA